MKVEDAWQARYWRTQGVRNPAFFVPQVALRNLSELKRMLDEGA